MTTYTFVGNDMGIGVDYSPQGLPTAGDTVTTEGLDGYLSAGESLTIGVFNNGDDDIVIYGTLTITTYNDTGDTFVASGGALAVNSDYTANSVSIDGVGSTLTVSGTLTVSNQATLGLEGLYVSNGATEKWNQVVLAGSASSPLLVQTGASVEITTSFTFQGGDLTVTNGGNATIDPNVTMSNGSLIVGVLQTTGPTAAAATFNGNLTIGSNAGARVNSHGTLNVQGNLIVDNGGGTGIYGGNVNVHGTTGLSIGMIGSGQVGVQLGGQLTVDQGMIDLGVNKGSLGNLTIDGAGSQVNYSGGTLTVGDAGTGQLFVQDGATQTFTGVLEIGGQSTSGTDSNGRSSVLVSGQGSSLTVSRPNQPFLLAQVNVGGNGNGQFSVTSSARSEVDGNLTAGGNEGVGQVYVNSSGVLTVTADLIDADSGVGDIEITNKGFLNLPGYFLGSVGASTQSRAIIANNQGSQGTLNLNNGTMSLSGSLFAGEAVVDGGRPSLGGNATIELSASSNATVYGDFTADNAQTTIQSASTLSVYNNVTLGNLLGSNATMTVTGAGSKLEWGLTLGVGQQPGNGTLNIQAGGSASGDITDQVSSLTIGGQGSGTVNVDGNGSSLEVWNASVLGGFLDHSGDGSLTASDSGAVQIDHTLTVSNRGEPGFQVSAISSGSITIGHNTSSLNPFPGTISVESDGTLVGSGSVQADNGIFDFGRIEAQGGVLDLRGNIVGSTAAATALAIDGDATLEIEDGCDVAVNFQGAPATLKLDAPIAFVGPNNTGHGQIGGFNVNDTIELRNVQVTQQPEFGVAALVKDGHKTYYDPTMIIFDTNNNEYVYQLIGAYTDPNLSVSVDANGNSFITLTAGSYAAGVMAISANPSSGDLSTGNTVDLTLSMAEAMIVSGGPLTLSLNDGGTAFYDAAHSTATSLVFDYTVGANDHTNNLAVTAVNSNGATITDSNGTPPDFQLALQSLGLSVNTNTPQPPSSGPVVTTGNPVVSTSGGSPVTLDSALIVSDQESTTLASATVQIAGGTFAGDGDMLSANTTGTAISANYNSTTETLTLSGTDTLADYQAVLKQVTFTPSASNPTNSGADPTRAVSWTANDGISASSAVGTTVSIASNAPPPSPPPPPTPAGTTADVIMRDNGNGDFEIYDLGSNAILAAGAMGQVGLEWQIAGLGSFSGSAGEFDDMLLRNGNTGQFEIYDISNNTITNAAPMGQVGEEWSVAGFGDFSSRAGESDMLMRNSGTGQFEIYDISNNQLTSAAPMGQVGLEWQVAGFGDFSTRANETDMLMRNSNTGAFEIYDISNNQLTAAASMGQVGLEWSVAGFGDFSGNANETDMLMRNGNTGAFEIYDVRNNQLVSAAPMGQVGLEWSVAGFGPINGAGASDMLMRDANNGAFEVYDITNNQLAAAAPMGQVGSEWSVAGIAADPPDGAAAPSVQLAQAMAAFGLTSSALDTASSLSQPIAQPISAAALTAPNNQNLPAS